MLELKKKEGQTKQKIDDKLKAFKSYNFDDQLIRHMSRNFLRNSNLREVKCLVRIFDN